MACRFAGEFGEEWLVDELANTFGENVDLRRDHAGLGGDRYRCFGGGYCNDRHPQIHRLQHREPERGPARCVHEYSTPCEFGMQLGLFVIAAAADTLGGKSQRCRQIVGAYPIDIDRRRLG